MLSASVHFVQKTAAEILKAARNRGGAGRLAPGNGSITRLHIGGAYERSEVPYANKIGLLCGMRVRPIFRNGSTRIRLSKLQTRHRCRMGTRRRSTIPLPLSIMDL
jgi:hypothetical protein